MTVGTTDIFLLVIIVSTLVVGFFWGAVRSLLLLAAWVLAFLAGAYLKTDLGAYLAREWGHFSADYNDMAAFGIIFVGLLLAAPIVIFIVTRGNERVTRFQVLDDLVGAGFAVFVSVIGIGGVIIVLGTYYGGAAVDFGGGPQWTANLYGNLLASSIGGGINDHIVPIIGYVFGPFLPSDVREVFG